MALVRSSSAGTSSRHSQRAPFLLPLLPHLHGAVRDGLDLRALGVLGQREALAPPAAAHGKAGAKELH